VEISSSPVFKLAVYSQFEICFLLIFRFDELLNSGECIPKLDLLYA
jgi:hypothetical protein